MKKSNEMKVTCKEIDRITGAHTWETTIANLIEGGWEIDDVTIYELSEGAKIQLYSPNGRRVINITKSK